MYIIKKIILKGASKNYLKCNDSPLIQFFKDDLVYRGRDYHVKNKGIVNNNISALLMSRLESCGIKTHFKSIKSNREQEILALNMLPFKILTRNYPGKKSVASVGFNSGSRFNNPLHYYIINQNSERPYFLNESEIIKAKLVKNLDAVVEACNKVHHFLTGYFSAMGMNLMYTSLQFGFVGNDELDPILGDEITLENCKVEGFELEKGFDLKKYIDFAHKINLY